MTRSSEKKITTRKHQQDWSIGRRTLIIPYHFRISLENTLDQTMRQHYEETKTD